MILKIEDKKKVVAELACYAHLSSSAIIASCEGLSVNKVHLLRKSINSSGMYLKVVRNTLLKIAIIDTKFSSVRKDLYGSLTIIFSPIDPSLLSQIVSDFMIQNNKFKVKHFSVFGRPSEVNKIEHFSFFPSLEDSIMLLCNALIETTAVFVRILNEIPVQSVRIFSAVAKIK